MSFIPLFNAAEKSLGERLGDKAMIGTRGCMAFLLAIDVWNLFVLSMCRSMNTKSMCLPKSAIASLSLVADVAWTPRDSRWVTTRRRFCRLSSTTKTLLLLVWGRAAHCAATFSSTNNSRCFIGYCRSLLFASSHGPPSLNRKTMPDLDHSSICCREVICCSGSTKKQFTFFSSLVILIPRSSSLLDMAARLAILVLMTLPLRFDKPTRFSRLDDRRGISSLDWCIWAWVISSSAVSWSLISSASGVARLVDWPLAIRLPEYCLNKIPLGVLLISNDIRCEVESGDLLSNAEWAIRCRMKLYMSEVTASLLAILWCCFESRYWYSMSTRGRTSALVAKAIARSTSSRTSNDSSGLACNWDW